MLPTDCRGLKPKARRFQGAARPRLSPARCGRLLLALRSWSHRGVALASSSARAMICRSLALDGPLGFLAVGEHCALLGGRLAPLSYSKRRAPVCLPSALDLWGMGDWYPRSCEPPGCCGGTAAECAGFGSGIAPWTKGGGRSVRRRLELRRRNEGCKRVATLRRVPSCVHTWLKDARRFRPDKAAGHVVKYADRRVELMLLGQGIDLVVMMPSSSGRASAFLGRRRTPHPRHVPARSCRRDLQLPAESVSTRILYPALTPN